MMVNIGSEQMCQGRNEAIFDDRCLSLVVLYPVHELLRNSML